MRTESENFLNNADFVEKKVIHLLHFSNAKMRTESENFLNNADFVEKNDMQIGIY